MSIIRIPSNNYYNAIEGRVETTRSRDYATKRCTKGKILISESRSRYFGKFDTWLDKASSGPRWLAEECIAQVIADALHYRDDKVFDLICYCIMPNHIHVIFHVGQDAILPDIKSSNETYTIQRDNIPLYKIMHSFKRFTASEGNKILKRTGHFWQHESYDHIVRDSNELERIISYVFNNPVKAVLCKSGSLWKWSYIQKKYTYIIE